MSGESNLTCPECGRAFSEYTQGCDTHARDFVATTKGPTGSPSPNGPLTLYICECGFWGRWQDERAHRRVCAMDSTTAEYVPAVQSLRLAQALRVIRDTTFSNDYVVNVATRALAEAGVPDPPPEETL